MITNTLAIGIVPHNIPSVLAVADTQAVTETVQEPAKEPVQIKEKVTAIGEPYTPENARALVDHYASKYDVSGDVMWSVIKCEDPSLDPKQQSLVRYSKDHPEWGVVAGERERSYGLVQIHLPGNKNVTYAQATNPDFALDFLAKNLAAGRGRMWTCYRNMYA